MRSTMLIVLAALVAIGVVAAPTRRPRSAAAAPSPTPTPTASRDAHPRWPLDRFALGLMDGEGGAAKLAASGGLDARYQYLSGGVNTANPWPKWGQGDGRFVTDYVSESVDAGVLPVFSYYELRQSLPGANVGDEAQADLDNLRSTGTMRAYFENVRLLMQRLGQTDATTVVHVEPDLWGYAQQRHGDEPARTPAAIATSGVPELAGLPNTLPGFAQAWVRMRDQYAPKVVLGYALSIWGTNKDITISDEPDAAVDALAARAAHFARRAAPGFELTFAEFNDRTSGYARAHGAGPEAWWDAADFRRHARFLRRFHAAIRRPIVLWQIPLGNQVERAMDNSPRHYQDNRVQWLLSARGHYAHLRAYRAAGAVAALFGPGQADDTHASDDGGYFYGRARAYARAGRLRTTP